MTDDIIHPRLKCTDRAGGYVWLASYYNDPPVSGMEVGAKWEISAEALFLALSAVGDLSDCGWWR